MNCGDGAAYVLGALEPDEADEFRRHLNRCATCRGEVAGMRRVADALLMAVPQHRPPAGLRRRVLRTVRARTSRCQTAGAQQQHPRLPARSHSRSPAS